MKERVTLTIDEKLIRRIDASIDGMHIKNRSHAVELLIRKGLDQGLPEHAIVLCGTTQDHLRAAMSEVEGKTMVEHNVQHLLDQGVPNIYVITAHAQEITQALKHLTEEVRIITESTPLGTAGAIHLAKPYLSGTFILTNASSYKEVNLKEMYAFHSHHKGTCTIALTSVSDPTQYGVALLNGNRVITFVEKPRKENAPSNLISAGLYIMDLEVFNFIPDGYARMEHDVFPKLAKQDTLYGYNFPGTYLDVQ